MRIWNRWNFVLMDEEPGTGAGGGDGPAPNDKEKAPEGESEVLGQLKEMRKMMEKMGEKPGPPRPPQEPQRPPQAAPAPSRKELEEAFWKDPLGITNAIAQQAAREGMSAVAQHSAENLEYVAREQVRNENPALFDKFRSEIEEKLSAAPPQFRSNPHVWRNAFNLVKGEKSSEVAKFMKEQQESGPASPSNKPSAGSGANSKTLTPEEKHWAKAFNLSEEEYLHGRKFANEQEGIWPEVVTFDSDERNRRKRADSKRKTA